jgi:hypothetical protein
MLLSPHLHVYICSLWPAQAQSPTTNVPNIVKILHILRPNEPTITSFNHHTMANPYRRDLTNPNAPHKSQTSSTGANYGLRIPTLAFSEIQASMTQLSLAKACVQSPSSRTTVQRSPNPRPMPTTSSALRAVGRRRASEMLSLATPCKGRIHFHGLGREVGWLEGCGGS